MRKFLAVCAVALTVGGVAACNTPGERAAGGGLIGAATGAGIGAAVGGGRGALAGALIGGAGGALIGAGTAAPVRERCYYSRRYRQTVCEEY